MLIYSRLLPRSCLQVRKKVIIVSSSSSITYRGQKDFLTSCLLKSLGYETVFSVISIRTVRLNVDTVVKNSSIRRPLERFGSGLDTCTPVSKQHSENTRGRTDYFRCMFDLPDTESHLGVFESVIVKFPLGYVTGEGFDQNLYRKENGDPLIKRRKMHQHHSHG